MLTLAPNLRIYLCARPTDMRNSFDGLCALVRNVFQAGNAMKTFIQRHGESILGVLSGFDRMRFRGSLRLLCSEGGVATWLGRIGVAVKDFLGFAEGLTKRLCQTTERSAAASGRKVEYLPAVIDKEALVAQMCRGHGVGENGLIAVLSTLEMGMTYKLFRRRDNGFAVLRRTPRKCLHYYFYWQDARFGLTQVRLCSWFPFDVHVVLNCRRRPTRAIWRRWPRSPAKRR